MDLSALQLASGAIFQGSNPYGSAGLTNLEATVAPPQMQQGMRFDPNAPKIRVGLIAMIPNAQFSVVCKEKRSEDRAVSATSINKFRATVRIEQRKLLEAQEACIKAPDDEKSKKAYLAQLEAEGGAKRLLALAESRGRKNPTQVLVCTAQDPGLVPDAFMDPERFPKLICLHHGCQGDRWDSPQDMKRAHPSDEQMRNRQEIHVWGLWSDVPAYADDPDGPVIGLIAPFDSSGIPASTYMTATLEDATRPALPRS